MNIPQSAITYFAIFFVCASVSETLPTISEEERSETLAAFERWRRVANEAVQNPSDENLRELGLGIRKLDKQNIYPLDSRVEVKAELVAAMCSIPRHADFFESEMVRAWKIWDSGNKDHTNIYEYNEPDFMRLNIIKTLGELRTTQSVEVLGGFLVDTRHMLDPRNTDVGIPSANAFLSQRCLIQMLDDPPTDDAELFAMAENLKTWQLWFEQVKAGTRTFRFKGDSQPYTLKGPAERALRPGADIVAAGDHRSRGISGERTAEGRAESDHGNRSGWIVGSILAAATALWLVWRRFQGKRGRA